MRRRFKEAREAAGLTREEVAKRLRISERYLAAIENGHHLPGGLLLQKMAAIYKLDEIALLLAERDNGKEGHAN
ncbi:MAG TPA: helix-turn-helix domain-containing protein [Chthonomonas sp.]|uniref:helix-turn-helix transcriptional regulator n=1 Tax=Chthonomonas sp. TaxID=2282153 RepID=UPI002B4B418B|nr:helix-turn-helix domain-containing protein [Chthonomonas sp.]HLI47274.1 helix-turn-helix domain-containing protein [Chthonomonas sp.]